MDETDGLPFGATGCTKLKRPRQNRVTPFGTIEATHHKGTLMGNRGDLHAPDGTLGRPWRSSRWISCLLDTGDGWKAPMDKPGRNYPLFFLDEAVALAARIALAENVGPPPWRSSLKHGKSATV